MPGSGCHGKSSSNQVPKVASTLLGCCSGVQPHRTSELHALDFLLAALWPRMEFMLTLAQSSCSGLLEGKMHLASRVSSTRHQPWSKSIMASGQALVCRPGHAARCHVCCIQWKPPCVEPVACWMDLHVLIEPTNTQSGDNQSAAKQRKCIPHSQGSPGSYTYMTHCRPCLPRLTDPSFSLTGLWDSFQPLCNFRAQHRGA